MKDQIKIITAPDTVFDQSRKLLIVQPFDDLKDNLEQWVLDGEDAVSIYYYTKEDQDLKWLLTVANIADVILLEMDNFTEDVSQFTSYLISLPATYYRCNHPKSPWELLNQNRFYDFPDFERK